MAKQTPEPTGGSPEQAQEPQVERVLVEKLRGRGIDIDAEDDDSLLESFEQLLADRESAPPRDDYERLKKLEPFATEYTQHAADFQRWKSEQAAKQAEATKEDKPSLPAPPKIDPALAQVIQAGVSSGQVTRTSSGIFEAKEPAYAAFVQQYNLAAAQRREFFQRFEDDPGAFIAEYAKPHIEAIEKSYKKDLESVREEMKSLRKKDSESSIEKFFERNYQEFWAVDEEGQIQKDAKGQGVLNARGQLYAKMMADLAEEIPDEGKRHEKAVAFARQVPVEASVEEPADRKKRFLKRAAEKSGRATNRLVERPASKDVDAAVTAGKKRGKMDWDELMKLTTASLS